MGLTKKYSACGMHAEDRDKKYDDHIKAWVVCKHLMPSVQRKAHNGKQLVTNKIKAKGYGQWIRIENKEKSQPKGLSCRTFENGGKMNSNVGKETSNGHVTSMHFGYPIQTQEKSVGE